jgi:predicted ribosome quality control (RQC) complex YloA/Tae2 family protein
MDNLTLQALVRELQPRLLDTTIQKIRMRDRRTLLLQLRAKQTLYLQIVLFPGNPGCFVTEAPPSPVDGIADDVVATLRKYLLGARITAFRKELSDRVVQVAFENYRLSAKREEFLLMLELVPNRARALLLNADHDVIAVLPSQSAPLACRYRALSTLEETVDSLNRERFESLISKFGIQEVWRHIFGFGPLWVEEVLQRSTPNLESIWKEMQSLLDRVRQGPYSPTLYRPESAVEQERRSQPDRSIERIAKKRSSSKAPIVLPFPFDSLLWADLQSNATMNEAVIDWQA